MNYDRNQYCLCGHIMAMHKIHYRRLTTGIHRTTIDLVETCEGNDKKCTCPSFENAEGVYGRYE